MPTFYNYTEGGQVYSFDDVFVPADAFRQGTLFTWGRNDFGQLGDFASTNRSTPITTTTGGTNWKQVAGGGYHTAAIKTDGTLWLWGRNNNGQLGDDTTQSKIYPVTTILGGTNWKQVACGYRHTAAIKTDGTLWTWGGNSYGQLGDNTVINKTTPVTTFAGGTNWKQISCGQSHIAAIKTDGTLWLWGRNDRGTLGDSTKAPKSTPVTTFAGGTNWKQVSCGYRHTVAIKTDGTLWTWGRGWDGELGIDGRVLAPEVCTPVTTLTGGTNWKQVSSGYNHSAAIKTDGTLWIWGQNTYGQLGRDPDNSPRLTPITTFVGGTNWADTTTSASEELYTFISSLAHSVAIKTDGTLWTWGRNIFGALGDNTITQRNTPITTFAGGTNWKQVGGGGYFTTAIKTDGTLWTWGRNAEGTLGDNTTIIRSTPVTTFAGGNNWKQVSGGQAHTAAIKTDGTLWVWGSNSVGQLGDNTIVNRSTPVTTFAGGSNWKQVAGGGNHFAAIKTDGTLWTWGRGIEGQLGNNTAVNRSTPVTTFAGGTNWKQVSAGTNHTTAIKTDGTLWTWGVNSNGVGQLGDNTIVNRSTPVTTFAGGTNWKQVSCATSHTAAIKTDGTLWIWGLSTSGQIGDNTIISRSTPVTTFAGGTNWKQVSGGGNHTVALSDDGVNKRLYLWGQNTYQQLGTDWISFNLQQLQTFAGGTNWKQVECGSSFTAAVKTDGTLWTWGRNPNGSLGDNTIINRSTPVTTFAGGTNWKQVAGGSLHTVATTYIDDYQ